MNLRSTLTTTGALIGAGVLMAPTASASELSGQEIQQADPMTSYVMERDGTSEQEARAYLDTKDDQQQRLQALEGEGVSTDGAWFEGTELVVAVNPADADAVEAAGLRPSTSVGQSELDAIAQEVLDVAGTDLRTVGANLPESRVDVRLSPDAPASLRSELEAMDRVHVEEGSAPLRSQADVVPGQIMDLAPGTNCTLGYPGTTADGNNVMLTAGHCVEGLPDVLDSSGTHIGEGVDTRFETGRRSVDMGLMDIDSEDVGQPYVDSRGHSGSYPVRGMSKNAIGTEICKAGNTTGWTCGTIQAYNRTVNYGGTIVTGLAEATVCTEGGDSGGAYIGVGNRAQGMTSGGPAGAECGWNQGHDAGSYSFYQPVVDAANYYGVTLETAD